MSETGGISSRKGVAVLCIVIVIAALFMIPVIMTISRRYSYRHPDVEQLFAEDENDESNHTSNANTRHHSRNSHLRPIESPTALPLYEPRYDMPEAPPPAYRSVVRPEKSNE